MKKYTCLILALAIFTGAFAQVNHSYTFAVGNPDGVTLTWDAFSDELDIQGCYLYKRVKYYQPEELISPELIVSDDSTYSFTDTGQFDPVYPPVYSLHCVTADSVYITNDIFAFQEITIEFLGNNTILIEVQAWNNEQCCRMVHVFHGGISYGNVSYDDIFSYQFLLDNEFYPLEDVWFRFEDHDWYIDYSDLIIYFTYIEKLVLTSSNTGLNQKQLKLNAFPNPATTELWLQLPENQPLSAMQIQLYSPAGRLLYQAEPQDYFHKIDVARLPAGLYLVRLWDGERWYAKKLVVR